MTANLTDAKVASAKPKEKRYNLYDGDGLWLMVYPSGRKTWLFVYQDENGKPRQITLGKYPVLTLSHARQCVLEKQRYILLGMNPQNPQNAPFLREAVEVWFEEWRKGKKPDTEKDVWARFENHVFPVLGNKPILELTTDHFEDLIIDIQAHGLYSTARYILIYCKKVFLYKPVRKMCGGHNPVFMIKASEIMKPYDIEHRTRIPITELPELINAIDTYPDLKTRIALQLMLLWWVRTNELLGARWEEFDFENRLWRIPASRMKMKREHIVPLCTQSIKLLRQLKESIDEGEGLFFKYGVDDSLLLNALYSMGYKGRMTTHGFRSIASTKLNENMTDSRAVEAQLSHIEMNSSKAAYNAAVYLNYRIDMMQEWADYIDTLRA